MDYQILTTETVVDYIRSLSSKGSIFTGFDNLEVVEIGDGNRNFVYLITNLIQRNTRIRSMHNGAPNVRSGNGSRHRSPY